MKIKRILTLCLVLLLSFNALRVVSAETYDYQVGVSVTRTFDRNDVVLDNVNDANNEVEITYTVSFDSINKASIPVKTPPKEVVLIIDKSGSMKWDLAGNKYHNNATRMSIAKSAATTFVENISDSANIKLSVIPYDSRAAIYSFNGNNLIDISNGHNNKNSLKNYINNLSADGGTNVGDAIRRGYDVLNAGNPDADKFLVFLTDGEPTVYSRISRDNNSHYNGTGSAPSTRANSSEAKSYAIKMTERLEVFTKNYFVAFSDNGANKLKEISETIRSYYKKALTAEEINDIYEDISYEISADLSVEDLSLYDELPSGFTVVNKPDEMLIDGTSLTMPIGDVPYVLNGDGTAYEAQAIEIKIIVKTDRPGEYNFTTSGNISYGDVDGQTKTKNFRTNQLKFTREPVKNVLASRTDAANGNKLNEVDLSWDVYPGSTAYKVYKVVAGVDTLIETIAGNGTTTLSLPIYDSDEALTTYKVEALLADAQVSGKGEVSTDTTPSILNVNVYRENNNFVVSWDAVEGATKYMLTPNFKGIDGTTTEGAIGGLFRPSGGRVTFIYPFTPSVTDGPDDLIKFYVDGEKSSVAISGASSDELRVKQVISSSIVTGLDNFNYGQNKEVEINFESESTYPSGIEIYNPVFVVELIRPDHDETPLEFSYSTLRTQRSDSVVGVAVTRTGEGSVKIYTELTYTDNKLPAGEDLSIYVNFGIAYDLLFGTPEVKTIDNLRSKFEGLELYKIESQIESLLAGFYASPSNMMFVKTYIMYNTTNKTVTTVETRDEILGLSLRAIQLKNVSAIDNEF